ncbi:hypothetical protein KVR01_001368 [Diaporthe batatas]|uniref:uncharacterized protein n=1 Tax=Diaporthe batatas TaxID=748121 RepID=UPI001D03F72D|nr:uncharacterized protein KVR01_001368 [Diaporthe batatas]KAG8168619.1 hypothetical protein KVR01_001368 [Diaporthe batatas]
MASNGRVDGGAQDAQDDNERPGPGTGALGISYPALIQRSESSQPLVANAAPTAGPSSPPYDTAAQFGQPDYWHPQLSGRTLGGFSPTMDSPNPMPSEGELKGSIYTAWDRGSKTATYQSLNDDRGAAASGGRRRSDDDSISLDSLQMQDESQPYSSDTVGEGGPGDYDNFKKQVQGSPRPAGTPADVRVSRLSWLAVWLIILSVYSTILSGLWLGVAIAQPRWGRTISSHGSLELSTANVLTAILAKTIELSFVTVFVAFIGQVLTRRAMATNAGMTMAEMTMRTWITQPGSLLANGQTLRYAGHTVLGILTLIATLVAMLYTTASDTMVRPKLRFSGWHDRDLESYVMSPYGNAQYVKQSCSTPLHGIDSEHANESCLAVQYSGDAHRNLQNFMATWRDMGYNGSSASRDMALRPAPQTMLYDNITMIGSWIEAQYSDTEETSKVYDRVVNNVSLALPHPGVYKAATNDKNNILQPSDLDGLGSYNISASVISPAVNALCVNMNKKELAPLVYTEWPNANNTDNAAEPRQVTGHANWQEDVPVVSEDEWLNSTVVDDIFRWGPSYGRLPPVFQLYPIDYNIITNITVWQQNTTTKSDAIYMLGKSPIMEDYTLCELRSWPAIQCSTQFDVSGLTGMTMAAQCAQSQDFFPENAEEHPDRDAYVRHMGDGEIATKPDWADMVTGWALAIDLNGGATNSNASNARILTELALTEPRLGDTLPSLAEALAVLVSSTLVTASVDTPFIHYWEYDWDNMTGLILPAPGALAHFHARVRTQEYASWHSSDWQGVFYLVLAFTFLLNLLCLGYFCRVGLVKDFLEPTNLFALATARPGGHPRHPQHAGSAAAAFATPAPEVMGTPQPDKEKKRKTSLAVPYRLAFKEDANNYYFEEAEDEKGAAAARATALDGEGGLGAKRKSYYRLSSRIGL